MLSHNIKLTCPAGSGNGIASLRFSGPIAIQNAPIRDRNRPAVPASFN
jgi:hypothetical protein